MATRRLAVTSPLMHGPDVLALQWLLHQRGYYNGDRDGQYGPLTAQAVYRAKFWLGYNRPDQSSAALLVQLLKQQRKPTPAMQARAKKRLKAKPKTPLREKALRNLARKLGQKERPPDSNRVPWASEWYGIIGPWCAMAVTRAYVDAGSKAFLRGARYAFVPFIVADARAGRNNLTITKHPNPGDLVCYDWQRDGEADHVGLFKEWLPGAEGSEFYAVEGNTSVSSNSNGGEVMERHRKIRDVQVFVHVGR